MSYSKILKSSVKNSKMTYTQIVDECKKYIESIDKSYISKLINNKIPPPSDEVSHALEKALGIKENTLVVESYFEKAPIQMKEFVSSLSNMIINATVARMNFQSDIIKKAYIKEFEKLPLLNIFETFTNAIENGEMDIAKSDNIMNTMSFNITDDGYSPIIPIGSNVTTETCENYSNGDIVAVMIDEDKPVIIRKYYSLSESKAVLISTDVNQEPIIVDKKLIIIIGKVTNCSTAIN